MQVREFKAKDVKRLTKLLTSVKLPAPNEDASAYGLAILQDALKGAADDLWAWLADMAGMEVSAFDELPASAVLDVVEAIAKQEGARDFFGRLGRMIGGITAKPSGNGTGGQTSTSENFAQTVTLS